ncbi:DsbA family oxidoreductase [Haloarcula laminariae]|uniref:DsbA family oxidoreductase n=1 Tax=Haloarcula laminariae TaxID=2961577 RepID=UPI00240695D7|nr:DsbA family oxidoreductase [Halomicroarcula sp. FL173]
MSEQQANQRITVYSDYVCPFCYLGRASLEQYQETREEPLEIDWRPFDLRSGQRRADGSIDHSVDTGKDEEYFEEAKEGVRRLQAKYDVEMDLDMATDIDSLPAQIVSYALKQSEDYETWLAFDEAVLDALWRDGRDIGDADVLADIADSVGIDSERVGELLADETHRQAVHEQFQRAQQQGVTGVPTFAYDGHAARGAVPPAQLERLVDGV